MNLYIKCKEVFVNIVWNLYNRVRILVILFVKKCYILKCKLKEEFREWIKIFFWFNVVLKIRCFLRESSSVNFVIMDCLLYILIG